MSEDNKDNKNSKILKLKFAKSSNSVNEKKDSEQKKESSDDQLVPKENKSPVKSFRGMPQIIQKTTSNITRPHTPFRKKTFIPKHPVNENKFAPPVKLIQKKTYTPNDPLTRGFKKPLINKPKFLGTDSNMFKGFSTPMFEKKNTNSDISKKKKSNKKESSKPKSATFSNLVGNNFIGRIENSTLEYAEYFKVRKERRSNNPVKNKTITPKIIDLESEISLKELASKLSIKLDDIIKQAKYIGYEPTDSENSLVDIEVLEIISTSLGHQVIRKDSINKEKFDIFNIKIEEDTAIKRPPIVAIIGHVDHGKTSLLDKIRKSNITKSEVGGITQKIGAYSITTKEGKITFIDTPGHAAFANMRQRGIDLNDITILVISAVEGIKDQTIEAIKQIKVSNTQLIIAATKCDLPNCNLEKIKQDLTKYNIMVKDYGGEIELIEVSAVTNHNINFLLQTILVYADIMDLKSNPKAKAIGVVLESKIDAKSGVLSSLLVQQGTLKVGEIVSTTECFGKIKGMWDDQKNRIKEATAGMPVEILGLSECPTPGEKFAVVDQHETALKLTKKPIKIESETNSFSFEDLFAETKPTLNLVINSETQGGLEAIDQIFKTLNIVHSTYKVISKSVGRIKDADLDLAKLTNATILNYNLSIPKDIEFKAKNDKIKIISSKIIYEIESMLQEILEKLITLIANEIYVGTAVVKRIFKSSKIGNISGSFVKDGKILKGAIAKVYRKGDLIFEGKIESLKKGKDDVKEVVNSLECGIFTNFKDIEEDDEIVCYKVEYKKPE